MELRNHRDLYAGLMFMALGGLFIYGATEYPLGTAAKMGPAYFPTLLGGLLALLGLFITIGAFAKSAPKLRVERIQLRPIVTILVAVALFAFLLPKLGMVASLAVLIFVSASASHEFSFKDTAIATVVLIALSYVVFVWGLELQFPVWPTFLTN